MAKVKTAFHGVPDGEVMPKEFKPGDEVTGDLAAVAVAQGWASDDDGGQKADGGGRKSMKGAPENK